MALCSFLLPAEVTLRLLPVVFTNQMIELIGHTDGLKTTGGALTTWENPDNATFSPHTWHFTVSNDDIVSLIQLLLG
jgi:hypothetical protein